LAPHKIEGSGALHPTEIIKKRMKNRQFKVDMEYTKFYLLQLDIITIKLCEI